MSNTGRWTSPTLPAPVKIFAIPLFRQIGMVAKIGTKHLKIRQVCLGNPVFQDKGFLMN
jgi:hypothetical protein